MSADQLPEFEPLTPELVEDEAIRGDFVIRWATILLAVLFGWTQVSDTSLLVRIRSAHEHLIPFGHDTFSASAADRTWHNLAWLVDPVLAAAYAALGSTGLTVLGAITGGAAFWALSRTSVRGVSTWWGSICGAIAIVAAFPHLTPGPASIQLLGTALLLLQLYRWSEDRSGGFTWRIPAILWVWSQLDPEAWVGPAILVLFAASWIGLRGSEEGDDPQKTKNLGKLTGAGVLAWLIHPMHYHVLLSPLNAFRVEYPELRAYKFFDLGYPWEWYSIVAPEFSQTADVFAMASLLLCVVALVTLAINFRRLTWEWLLPWGGIVALAGVCTHLLPVAGLLSCVLATLNAQIWYRATFSQQYTVDSLPLLWNRGGRALTVVTLLLLGILASNGMLMGRDGRRIGAGFSPRMAANIAGAEKLAKEVQGKEVFNFRLEQGDLLIWAGLKPYVDRRLSLYTQGSVNLLEQHRKLRKALLPANSKDKDFGQPEFWKAEFDRLHLNQAIPRLSEPAPDYATMVRLQQQGWQMSSLESFGAVLSRTDSKDEVFQKYMQENHGVNYVEVTFRKEPDKDAGMNLPWDFPRRPTLYDTWLWQPQSVVSESVQLAGHEQKIVELMVETAGNSPNTFVTTTALAMSAFRHARAGVAADPQSAPAYRVLARSAQHLFQVEANIARTYSSPHNPEFWLYHAVHAYHHALQIDSDFPEDHEALALLQLSRGKYDLALQHFQQVYRLTGQYTSRLKDDPLFKQDVKDKEKLVLDLKAHVRQTEDAVLKVPTTGGTWEKAFQTALGNQCPGIALRVLEENRTKVAEALNYQIAQVNLLMDVGRTEDALRQANSLAQVIPQAADQIGQPMASEIRLLNMLASLSVGDSAQVEKQLETESRIVTERSVQELLSQAPLAAAVGLQVDLQAASQALVSAQAINLSADRWSSLQYMIALSELSTGRNLAARERMKRILDTEPDNLSRPVIAFYIQLMFGEECDPLGPAMKAALEAMKKQAEANPPKRPIGPAAPGAAPATAAPPSDPPAVSAPAAPPATDSGKETPAAPAPDSSSTPAPDSPAAPPN
jgi:tetratricopeptide (TPR) repeat protein